MRVSQKPQLLLHFLTAGMLAGAGFALAEPLQAQSVSSGAPVGRALAMQAGQWYADVDGIVVGSIRAELPVGRTGRWLFVPALTYSHYTLGSAIPELDVLVPEALVHLQLGRGRMRPYVGGGGGLVLVNMMNTVDPVFSLAGGLRWDLTSQWGARIEVDTRAFGPFNVGSVGWSVGVARHF